jgi:putative transposase
LKAHDLITSPAYVVIKAADQFHTKTTRPNEIWQTDFTYFKIVALRHAQEGLDVPVDRVRRLLALHHCMEAVRHHAGRECHRHAGSGARGGGLRQRHVLHKPRLLSDNGPSYIAGELAEYIEANKMSHVRGAPMHPQTQGKIERWHQTLKSRILLENYFLPGDLEAQIEAFVEHYNHHVITRACAT